MCTRIATLLEGLESEPRQLRKHAASCRRCSMWLALIDAVLLAMADPNDQPASSDSPLATANRSGRSGPLPDPSA